MATVGIDIESERLALELSRADVAAELQLPQNASQHEMLSSQLSALDTQLQELDRIEEAYAGQRMQQSMYTAMLADSHAIGEQRQLEQQAITDRATAAALSGCTAPHVPEGARQQVDSGYHDERLTQLEEAALTEEADFADNGSTAIGDSVFGSDSESINGSQTTIAAHDEIPPPINLEHYMNALRLDEERRQVECVVCTNFFLPSQTITLPCGDTWCRSCISQRFEEAVVNEGAWPVKCCRRIIPVESIRTLLTFDLRNRFTAKSIEWSDTDRVYCHEPTCSTYIPRTAVTERVALCPGCSRQTCAECKGLFHTNPPCPEDTANDDMLEELARESGWPRCPGCQHYVEITHGCNHMT